VDHAPSITARLSNGSPAAAERRPRILTLRPKPLAWSAEQDWKDTQVLLETFAKLKPEADLSKYYTNEYLAEPPYLPKK